MAAFSNIEWESEIANLVQTGTKDSHAYSNDPQLKQKIKKILRQW